MFVFINLILQVIIFEPQEFLLQIMTICLLQSFVYYNLIFTQSSNLELHTNFVYILLLNSRLFSLSRSLLKWKVRRYIALKNEEKNLILKEKKKQEVLFYAHTSFTMTSATLHIPRWKQANTS